MVNIADEIANGKVPFVVLVIMSLFLVSLAAATGHGAVNITLLPMSTGAAALDGSPYGFFFVKASNPAEKRWTISIEGGGWCVGNAVSPTTAPSSRLHLLLALIHTQIRSAMLREVQKSLSQLRVSVWSRHMWTFLIQAR